MSEHIALYRKWRPMTFSDVVGQEHITRTLQNEIVSGRTGHAFLFCGGRGTGKTTSARILSRALNCTNPQNGNPCNECETCRGIISGEILDIIEIDAASNNGVENIRDLRDEARFCAANTKYKVYIIDEVHMLSTGAFNALLKLLEEPPEGVIFILATTETQKVPLTILSRCQRFDFKRITVADITSRLLYVAKNEGIEIDEDAARLIARSADGALRDALGLLEQCSADGTKITKDEVYSLLGITEKAFLYRTARSIATNDVKRTLAMVDEFIAEGKSASKFIESLTAYFTDLLKCHVTDAVFSENTEEELSELKLAAKEMSAERLMYSIDTLVKTASSLKYMTSDRVMLDMAVIKMCMPSYAEGEEALTMRIAELERRMSAGNFTPIVGSEEKIPDSPPDTKVKIKLSEVHKPTSEEFLAIEEKWQEICKATKNIKLLIALERSSVKEDNGELVLLFDDTDRIMLDILSEEETKTALSELIKEHTGFAPKITTRLASYYEGTAEIKKEDPIDLIVPEPIIEEKTEEPTKTEAPKEEEEEYSFEEPESGDEEFLEEEETKVEEE